MTVKKTAAKQTAQKKTVPSFTKEQLVNAARYRDKKDIVTGLLEDGKKYTIAEANSLIKEFLKRKVV